MKEWLLQNIVAILGAGCSLHGGVALFFGTWIRSKPSRQEVEARFQDVNAVIIEIKQEVKRSNDLHYKTAVQLGKIETMLTAFIKSSEKEDNNLKELVIRQLEQRPVGGRKGD